MKRSFWTWLAALAIVALVGDRVAALGLEQLVLRSQLRFSRLYRGGMNNDLVIIGNSRGVNGFYAPLIQQRTGARTLNLSYNGMSAIAAEAVLDDYLDHNARPRLIVFEVTNVYSNEDALKDLALFRFASPRLAALQREYHPRVAAACRVSHLIAFNNELFLRSLYYFRSTDQDWVNRGHIDAALLASADTMHPVALALPPPNVAALVRSVSRARRDGIAVELVVTPFLPAYRARLANFPQWKASLQESLGAPILDYSSAVSDDRDFGDRLHLNFAGSRVLLDRLMTDGVFARAEHP